MQVELVGGPMDGRTTDAREPLCPYIVFPMLPSEEDILTGRTIPNLDADGNPTWPPRAPWRQARYKRIGEELRYVFEFIA